MNLDNSVLKNDEKAVFQLRSLYRKYGYSQYKMSKFEEYDLYVRNKNFLVSDNIITFTDTDGKLIWECPNCGNRDQDTMNVARRTCGYIGTQYWNQGRTQEIQERVLHI